MTLCVTYEQMSIEWETAPEFVSQLWKLNASVQQT